MCQVAGCWHTGKDMVWCEMVEVDRIGWRFNMISHDAAMRILTQHGVPSPNQEMSWYPDEPARGCPESTFYAEFGRKVQYNRGAVYRWLGY